MVLQPLLYCLISSVPDPRGYASVQLHSQEEISKGLVKSNVQLYLNYMDVNPEITCLISKVLFILIIHYRYTHCSTRRILPMQHFTNMLYISCLYKCQAFYLMQVLLFLCGEIIGRWYFKGKYSPHCQESGCPILC